MEKALTELNIEELEYLNDFIKNKNNNDRIIINGPYYQDDKKIFFKLNKIKFEEKTKNVYKIIYSLDNYKDYNFRESPIIEFIINKNKIIQFENINLLNLIYIISYFLYIISILFNI